MIAYYFLVYFFENSRTFKEYFLTCLLILQTDKIDTCYAKGNFRSTTLAQH